MVYYYVTMYGKKTLYVIDGMFAWFSINCFIYFSCMYHKMWMVIPWVLSIFYHRRIWICDRCTYSGCYVIDGTKSLLKKIRTEQKMERRREWNVEMEILYGKNENKFHLTSNDIDCESPIIHFLTEHLSFAFHLLYYYGQFYQSFIYLHSVSILPSGKSTVEYHIVNRNFLETHRNWN